MTTQEIVKGYKIFNSDWTCRGFKYEVGKTYKTEEPIGLCKQGFHFCKNLAECFQFYDCITWNKFAEVEAIGDVVIGEDKCVTNKIRIVREIPFSEIAKIIKQNVSSYGVYYSDGVNNSDGVMSSNGVNCSNGVDSSNGVNYSEGVHGSNGVNYSEGVHGSNGVNYSDGVHGSNGVNYSDGVNCSNGVQNSRGVTYSDGVNNSYGVTYSDGVNNSEGVSDSFAVLNSYGVNNSIFVLNKKQTCTLFNKQVSKHRFQEVKFKLYTYLKGWKPTFNNLKSLYLKHGCDWKLTPIPQARELSKKEAWANMPKEAIDYLKSLPEFDAEIFTEITGIEI